MSSELPPDGYERISATADINEKVQAGDLYFDEEDFEWLPAGRRMLGSYVRDLAGGCVARKPLNNVESVKPQGPTVKRIRRSRK